MNTSSRAFWGLLIVTVLLYAPLCLSGEFIWDDPKLVELNSWTGSFSNLGKMFTQDLWASTPLGAGEFFYYRPVMLLSLTVDQALGLGAPGHRMHSLLWHLACVGLLMRLTRELKASPIARFVGISLFAMHPFQTEVLAHVAARNDAMATAGILGALLLLLPRSPTRLALCGAASLMAVAVFSKESAYLAPLLLWGLDRLRFSSAVNPSRYAAVLLPTGLALGLRFSLGGGGLPAPESWPAAANGLVDGIGFYLQSWVFPWDITPTVSTSEMQIFWPLSLIGAALLVGIFRLSGPWGHWGFLLALVGFLPALPGLLLTDNTGFRYVYLPLAGLSVALIAVVDRLRLPQPAWLLALPLFWFGASSAQLSSWSSDRALWSHAYEVAPGLQSACGLFKSIESEAKAQPLGEHRDRLFDEAEPWLARALEPPTRPYCCLSASRWMWERNQNEWMLTRPEPAIQWGSLALKNGCPRTAELVVPLSVSNALAGNWSLAEQQLQGLRRDPYGLRDVVLAAASLKRGERTALEAIAGENLATQRALEERARLLISASDGNAGLTGE
ncbi:MAG: hypothetical protein VXW32_01415 [Myxococcota bacterium]|nr:hypothetical protein [Myxococcota bacterium]